MGFVADLLGLGDVVSGLTGETQAEASLQGADIQAQAGREALAELIRGKEEGQQFLAPFEALGQQGLAGAGILTDPQAQIDFLQQNPLFQLSLDEARRGTQQTAAAGGRLSAGDTLQQLSKNVLLSAQPLLGQQQQNITNLLGLGQGLATTQANTALGVGSQAGGILTDIGATQAAGQIGAAQATGAGAQNLLSTGLTAGLLFSDSRLKMNIKSKGRKNDLDWFSWTWNALAKQLFGLEGKAEGVIAQKIMKSHPGSVIMDRGYLKVNYTVLGL